MNQGGPLLGCVSARRLQVQLYRVLHILREHAWFSGRKWSLLV